MTQDNKLDCSTVPVLPNLVFNNIILNA
ncbi:hypothetical protein Zm00014a_019652 [Zea mays]|uniref:Uncharacterized protein n=1 Tax=Zea mays TaxID=4577 RepID=A0A3L6DJZ9_MAIZE|nr:hypothetical protein Zm00014a_019652 [Zea mays]